MNERIRGHALACMTILIWGTTFISTKVLLRDITPLQILFTRFMIGYLALWAVCPRLTKIRRKKEELYFLAAGLCGVTLYFLMENIALTYTQASNVGIIVAVSPFFTMFFGIWLLKQRRPGVRFFIGFLIAMTGILCISLEGSQRLQLNPKGDLLALGAAAVWALYSTITKKISSFGYTTIPMTRRIFFYGLLCMLPVILFSGMKLPAMEQLTMVNIANILFLGLGASALCFVSWNSAVRILGTVQTSVYIYAVPVVTTLASVWILKETVTVIGIAGIVMILSGLLMSQNEKEEVHGEEQKMCHGDG
ncbi:DMT family transporter [Erysipelotrichaceae bacterium AF15-26LB]|nr:putative membrane protein [Erysipelotrichaceae bacterium 3_1_53]MCR0350384.1 DMT family transporter [[Clostridium] innocuum]RJV83329.1 DMT family transporter [Erysipelotrichaceae bacterium AF19-24AC]RJV84047.1 DMT family transporter [Erysipelotrichaceae bacterium AF15-26LB]